MHWWNLRGLILTEAEKGVWPPPPPPTKKNDQVSIFANTGHRDLNSFVAGYLYALKKFKEAHPYGTWHLQPLKNGPGVDWGNSNEYTQHKIIV